MSKWAFGALSCAVVALAGCGNPYAVKVHAVDYGKKWKAADIAISDIKLYRREALINERREEVAYLNKQLTASETIVFAPEIVRDLEVISALSAAVGLRFDAGAKDNYQRSREMAESEHEIQMLRLRAELDQLSRNVELLRAALPLQTAISDETLGDPGTAGAAPSSTVTAAATQLTAAIAALQTSLQTRLDAATTAPRLSAGSVNPSELYLDRAAHRSLLNQARNQANLDELHDADGSALLRLTFSASLPPAPKGYNATYSELRLNVVGPAWTKDDLQKAYRRWLDYVNTELVLQDPDVFRALAVQSDLFYSLPFHFSTRPGAVGCHGLRGKDKNAVCEVLDLAAPRYSFFRGDDLKAAALLEAEPRSLSVDRAEVNRLATAIRTVPADKRCQAVEELVLRGTTTLLPPAAVPYANARNYVTTAWSVRDYSNLVLSLEVQAVRGLQRKGIEPTYTSAAQQLPGDGHYDALTEVIVGSRCNPWPEPVPDRFVEAVRGDRDQMSVYNLEPREVVQQMSTTARAAEALALAAAVSAAVPSSGAAADAQAGFTRSATGKVDARERVPLVLAFAHAKDSSDTRARTDAFGWRFGPRIILDASDKALRLEHHPRTYDLSANVVVPGWWPYVTVEHTGRWSPFAEEGDAVASQSTRLRLTPNVADYNALTARLSGASSLRYPTAAIEGNPEISVCATSDFEIRGVNLWKATAVLIGGRLYEGSALDVSPDMGGIVVTTTKQTDPFPIAPVSASVPVRVLTPLGSVTVREPLRLNNALPDGRCDTPAEPKKAVEGPTITALDPAEISTCAANPAFTVSGTKLAGAIDVLLGSAQGAIARAATDQDPTVRVTFTTTQLRNEFAGIAKPKLVLRFANSVRAEKEVQLIAPANCP